MALVQGTGGPSIAGFLRWWSGALAGCLPGALRRAAEGGARQRLVIEPGASTVRLFIAKGESLHPIGEVPVAPGDLQGQRNVDQAGAVGRILRDAGLNSGEVWLALPRDRVLRRTVELPAAAAENLREVLGFEMDRHTPLKADEVYFDYRVVEHNAAKKRLRVDLVVVPRALADEARSLAETWGVPPDRIAVAEEGRPPRGDMDLLPAAAAPSRGGLLRRVNLALAVLLVGLGAAALYLPYARSQARLAATEQALDAVRAAALEANALQERVSSALSRARLLTDRKAKQPSATAVLAEVTRLLPDNTWVLKFGLRDGRVTVAGYSAKPASLIAILEASPMFAEVRFSSPVTLDQRIGLERFNLSAVLAPGGGT